MRLASVLILLVAASGNLYAQKIATTFQQAEMQGISIPALDSLYAPALSSGADSLKAVFRGREDQFYKNYVALLKDLNAHLKAKGFAWTKTTRCFNRIYFNRLGGIDYFLFNFKPGELTVERETEFKKLVNQFIQKYHFGLPADSNFSQCSPVTYSD